MSQIVESEMRTYTQGPREAETAKEGTELKCFYIRFLVELPQVISDLELTDEEILTLADKTGTFDFLYYPEEDIYNPSDGTPYEKR